MGRNKEFAKKWRKGIVKRELSNGGEGETKWMMKKEIGMENIVSEVTPLMKWKSCVNGAIQRQLQLGDSLRLDKGHITAL